MKTSDFFLSLPVLGIEPKTSSVLGNDPRLTHKPLLLFFFPFRQREVIMKPIKSLECFKVRGREREACVLLALESLLAVLKNQ